MRELTLLSKAFSIRSYLTPSLSVPILSRSTFNLVISCEIRDQRGGKETREEHSNCLIVSILARTITSTLARHGPACSGTKHQAPIPAKFCRSGVEVAIFEFFVRLRPLLPNRFSRGHGRIDGFLHVLVKSNGERPTCVLSIYSEYPQMSWQDISLRS
jgi:hypothetical protein